MRSPIRALALAVASLAVVSCGDSTAASSGKLNVQMTDAPFAFDLVSRVDVFVVRVDAKVAETDSSEASKSDKMDGWVTIATPNKSINLLDLTGGTSTNLGTTTLSSGTYKGFRLILDVDQSSITLKDGSHPDIKWPSAGKTGIKINLDQAVVVTADSTMMLLDFDVGRSFVMRGVSIKGNGLLFKPVIRAVAKELTGTVSGSVKADTPTGTGMAAATVEILKDGTALSDTASANIVRTTQTDASGNFKVKYLLPGAYVVRATPASASGYLPALLTGGLTIVAATDVTGKVIVVTK